MWSTSLGDGLSLSFKISQERVSETCLHFLAYNFSYSVSFIIILNDGLLYNMLRLNIGLSFDLRNEHRWASFNICFIFLCKNSQRSFWFVDTRSWCLKSMRLYKTFFGGSKDSLFTPRFSWERIYNSRLFVLPWPRDNPCLLVFHKSDISTHKRSSRLRLSRLSSQFFCL